MWVTSGPRYLGPLCQLSPAADICRDWSFFASQVWGSVGGQQSPPAGGGNHGGRFLMRGGRRLANGTVRCRDGNAKRKAVSHNSAGPTNRIGTAAMTLPEPTYFCSSGRDGSPSQPWSLVDCSAVGARLLVDNPGNVPNTFTLVQKGAVITLWKCRVAWRSQTHIGVTFETPHATPVRT